MQRIMAVKDEKKLRLAFFIHTLHFLFLYTSFFLRYFPAYFSILEHYHYTQNNAAKR